jgi:hypothetical protein
MTARVEPPLKALFVEVADVVVSTTNTYSMRDGRLSVDSRQQVAKPLLDIDEFKDRVFGNASAFAGTLKIELSRAAHSVNWLWAIPSIGTLTLINVLGVPFASHTVTVGLAAEVVSRGGEVVHTVAVDESATEYAAYYWGYSGASCLNAAWPGYPAVVAEAKVRALDALARELAGSRSSWEPRL